MESFISPDNNFALWAILLFSSALGIYGEKKGWFGKISGVIFTIILVAILAMLNIIPSASDRSIRVSVYDFVFKYVTPMAATFGMKQMITPALLVGILGYVIGTFLGVSVGLLLAP